MAEVVDHFELDESNVEFNYAAQFIQHTNKLVYLTGKAGTGKTTFLRYLRRTTHKNIVVLAPTGVAAVNAGGQTIHSFFNIAPGVYPPDDRRLQRTAHPADPDRSNVYDFFKYNRERLEIIRNLELLVIDEISMVRCDLLDVVDKLLRIFRKREREPFGGVQMLLIGDTFQLSPVSRREDWDILGRYYDSEFFFSAHIIKAGQPVYIELKKIYRQKDQQFIDLLNKVRTSQMDWDDLEYLNSKYDPFFTPGENDNYVTLATHNKIVDETNLTKLAELKTPLRQYEAEVTGTFAEGAMPTDRILQLKEGAQVMFIKNDRQKRFYNGKIAKIISLDEKKIVTEFSGGQQLTLEKESWQNIKYTWNEGLKKIEEEVTGTFIQFPLKLAWAITVHKSQGLTFENVIADLGSAFAPGQVYVALSRCTGAEGLVLKSRLGNKSVITDPRVIEFARKETPSTMMVEELNSGKADHFYKLARTAFKKNDLPEALNQLMHALRLRNDVETETFQRYMRVHINRFQKSQLYAADLLLKIADLKTENLHLAGAHAQMLLLVDSQEQKLREVTATSEPRKKGKVGKAGLTEIVENTN